MQCQKNKKITSEVLIKNIVQKLKHRKMKKKILFVLLLSIGAVSMPVSSFGAITSNVVYSNDNDGEEETSTSSSWEFYYALHEPTAEELSDISNAGKFGKEASYYYDLFKEAYVTKEEVVPGDPTRRTVIRKPEIYNSVRRIEKALAKSLKKNEISQEESEKTFCHVLKVSLAAIDSDTDSFEKTLEDNKKDTNKLLALFGKVNLKSIY